MRTLNEAELILTIALEADSSLGKFLSMGRILEHWADSDQVLTPRIRCGRRLPPAGRLVGRPAGLVGGEEVQGNG